MTLGRGAPGVPAAQLEGGSTDDAILPPSAENRTWSNGTFAKKHSWERAIELTRGCCASSVALSVIVRRHWSITTYWSCITIRDRLSLGPCTRRTLQPGSLTPHPTCNPSSAALPTVVRLYTITRPALAPRASLNPSSPVVPTFHQHHASVVEPRTSLSPLHHSRDGAIRLFHLPRDGAGAVEEHAALAGRAGGPRPAELVGERGGALEHT